MQKKTANDFDQELLYLFAEYVHGGIDRRGFLDRAAKVTVGGVTAAMLLGALSRKFAEAQVVAKDDVRLITGMPKLAAAVNLYGNTPPIDDVPKIKAPLLIHCAENDPRINAMWPAYETALKAAIVKCTMHMYSGTQHGFNNNSTPRIDRAAAKLAWQRPVDFFNKHLC